MMFKIKGHSEKFSSPVDVISSCLRLICESICVPNSVYMTRWALLFLPALSHGLQQSCLQASVSRWRWEGLRSGAGLAP